MSSTPMPWIIPQWFVLDTATGGAVMASNYLLFSYQENSTTKQDTYADSDLSTVNANPIVLDAFGRAPVFLNLTSYKFVLALPTASDPPAPADIVWTEDYVPAYGTLFANFDISGVAGETTDTDNNVVYLSDGTDGNTPGLWYLTNALVAAKSSSARTIGVAVAPILVGTTGTIRIAGKAEGFTVSNLTPGSLYYLSDAANGRVTSTPPAQNIVVLGKADTVSTMVIEPAWGLAGASIRGLMATVAQTYGGVKTFNVQPKTYIGTATTLPATIGGIYQTEVTDQVVAGGSTNTPVYSIGIADNVLSANGQGLWFAVGGNAAMTGANAKELIFRYGSGATRISLFSSATNEPSWWLYGEITRTGSSTASVKIWIYRTTTGFSSTVFSITSDPPSWATPTLVRIEATTGAASTLTQTFGISGALG